MNIKIKKLISYNFKRIVLFSLYVGDTVLSFLVCCRSEPALSPVTTQHTHPSCIIHLDIKNRRRCVARLRTRSLVHPISQGTTDRTDITRRGKFL